MHDGLATLALTKKSLTTLSPLRTSGFWPFPATAWAEGGQFNGPPSPAVHGADALRWPCIVRQA